MPAALPPLKRQPLSPWGHALAGAMGAVFSNALVYPLDTIKTRIQASAGESEDSTSSVTAPGPADDDESALSTAEREAKSKAATVLASAKRKDRELVASLIDVLKGDVGGLLAFYKGFGASMLNTFSMQYAYFFFYSLVRGLYARRLARLRGVSGKPATMGTAAELLLGALAGALAQIFTIPVAVIATRQQLSGPSSADESFLAVARNILAEDGPTGFWRGLKPGLVLTINPAITYGAFERIKGIVLRSSGKEKLSPGMAFLVGAASKSLATIVTYPYIMAKVRLQARPSTPGPVLPSSSDSDSSSPSFAEVAASGTSSEKKPSPAPKPAAPTVRATSAIGLLKQVYREKGFAGWYQGMSAQLFKAVLTQGILFMTKDQFEHYAYVLLLILARPRKQVEVVIQHEVAPALEKAKHAGEGAISRAVGALPTGPAAVAAAKAALPSVQKVEAFGVEIGKSVVEKITVDIVVDAVKGAVSA